MSKRKLDPSSGGSSAEFGPSSDGSGAGSPKRKSDPSSSAADGSGGAGSPKRKSDPSSSAADGSGGGARDDDQDDAPPLSSLDCRNAEECGNVGLKRSEFLLIAEGDASWQGRIWGTCFQCSEFDDEVTFKRQCKASGGSALEAAGKQLEATGSARTRAETNKGKVKGR